MENKGKETKLCKHCQTEIPKNANFCPNCRKKQEGIGKWIIIGIAALAIIVSLASGNDESNDNIDYSKSTESTNISQEENKNDNQNNNKEDRESISFEEVVVVDNVECTIKITDINPDNMWGYTLNVQLENKSDDKTYMYSVESASINGIQSDPFFATEVAAGKKSKNEISFSDSDLEDNGVGDYTDIELTFRVYDSNDWEADDVARETIHIYPYGEDRAYNFVRESKETDNVIIENDYITVIVTGYEVDDIFGYTVNLFLINKTDKNVMFSVDEASVNGYMADPFYAEKVNAGKCAFSSMSWSDTVLEDNDIASVEEIEFNFRAYDVDRLSDDYFANEVIVLKP